jgi:hypothetical protein
MIVTLSLPGSEDLSDITLRNVTLADNDLGDSASLLTLCIGEGFCPEGPDFPSGNIDVTNSIIAEQGSGCFTPYSGEVVSGGGNVIQNTTTGCDDLISGPPAPTTQVTASAIALQPLALNAPGDTETMALGSSSVARGAAVSAKCPETDQRGVARPSSSCDSGAFQTASGIVCALGQAEAQGDGQDPEEGQGREEVHDSGQDHKQGKGSGDPVDRLVLAGNHCEEGQDLRQAAEGRLRSQCERRQGLREVGLLDEELPRGGPFGRFSVVVRSSSSDSGNARITASVRGSNSSGAKAQASAKAKIDVIDPKPKPKPEPPTG